MLFPCNLKFFSFSVLSFVVLFSVSELSSGYDGRLKVLNYIKPEEASALIKTVVENPDKYEADGQHMLKAILHGDWDNPLFLKLESYNTLLYLFINSPDSIDEETFIDTQNWMQMNTQYNQQAERQEDIECYKIMEIRRIHYLDEGSISEYFQKFTVTGMKYYNDTSAKYENLPYHKQFITILRFHPFQTRTICNAVMTEATYSITKEMSLWRGLHLLDREGAGKFEYYGEKAQIHGCVLFLPSFSVFCRLEKKLARIPENECVSVHPCYGAPDVEQMLALREKNIHPLAL